MPYKSRLLNVIRKNRDFIQEIERFQGMLNERHKREIFNVLPALYRWVTVTMHDAVPPTQYGR